MKKLEKLVLQDVVQIPEKEQRSLYGGGSVVTIDGFTFYCPGSVEIWEYLERGGSWMDYCPRCQQNQEWGVIRDPNTSNENLRFISVWFEFFQNTLPHLLGVGGHINGEETYYSITTTDGVTIYGEADGK
jgi:hypothetical protein